MRYGTVAVNAWTGVGYATPRATWGAFPGHTLDDVQSGIGIIHNAPLLDHTERTVVTGPFRPAIRSILHGDPTLSPKPPWFVTNTTAARTGRLLTEFAAHPRWQNLPPSSPPPSAADLHLAGEGHAPRPGAHIPATRGAEPDVNVSAADTLTAAVAFWDVYVLFARFAAHGPGKRKPGTDRDQWLGRTRAGSALAAPAVYGYDLLS